MELIIRWEDDEGLCERKRAGLTRLVKDLLGVEITKLVSEESISEEVDFFYWTINYF